jgi:hypothetical protein
MTRIMCTIVLTICSTIPVLGADCPIGSKQSVSGVLHDADASPPWNASVTQSQPCKVTGLVGKKAPPPQTCLTEYFGTPVLFRATGTVTDGLSGPALDVASIECDRR